jgi:hypothetical protein
MPITTTQVKQLPDKTFVGWRGYMMPARHLSYCAPFALLDLDTTFQMTILGEQDLKRTVRPQF